MQARLLTITQAAERLGLSPSLVRRYCRQGRFGFKLGKQWVITEAEAATFTPNRPGRPRQKSTDRA